MLISVSAASVVVRLSHSSKFISVESIVFAIELEGDLVVDCLIMFQKKKEEKKKKRKKEKRKKRKKRKINFFSFR